MPAAAVQVAESPPGAVGAPVPFFVRRPNATDVSESIDRFPIDGLVALFQLDGRSYPKSTQNGDEKLVIVPGAKSAATTSAGQAEPDPPTKGGKVPANKSKGANKGGSEQPSPEDGGIDARWRAIRSEVHSNRCLVIGAGEMFSLATPPLFLGPAQTETGGAGERKPSALGAEVDAENCAGGEAAEEGGKAETGCAPGIVQTDSSVVDQSAMMMGRSSLFAVCLDFRIDVAGGLPDIENGQQTMTAEGGEGGDVQGGKGSPSANDTVVVRILSCGNDVEVAAVVRRWAPADDSVLHHTEAGPTIEKRGSGSGGTLASGGASTAGSLSTDARSNGGAPASTALFLPPNDNDDAMAPLTPTWYLHALTVRSGSYTGTVPCMDPLATALQQRRRESAGAAESPAPTTTTPPPSGACAVCDLAEWHALALISTTDSGGAPVSLCIDGDVVPLRQGSGGLPNEGPLPGESELLVSGAVIIGGTGGESTALAIKNLAVYNERLVKEQLRAATRVFRSWREEQQEAKAADAREDERWLEEARKAEEEEIEPGETTRATGS